MSALNPSNSSNKRALSGPLLNQTRMPPRTIPRFPSLIVVNDTDVRRVGQAANSKESTPSKSRTPKPTKPTSRGSGSQEQKPTAGRVSTSSVVDGAPTEGGKISPANSEELMAERLLELNRIIHTNPPRPLPPIPTDNPPKGYTLNDSILSKFIGPLETPTRNRSSSYSSKPYSKSNPKTRRVSEGQTTDDIQPRSFSTKAEFSLGDNEDFNDSLLSKGLAISLEQHGDFKDSLLSKGLAERLGQNDDFSESLLCKGYKAALENRSLQPSAGNFSKPLPSSTNQRGGKLNEGKKIDDSQPRATFNSQRARKISEGPALADSQPRSNLSRDRKLIDGPGSQPRSMPSRDRKLSAGPAIGSQQGLLPARRAISLGQDYNSSDSLPNRGSVKPSPENLTAYAAGANLSKSRLSSNRPGGTLSNIQDISMSDAINDNGLSMRKDTAALAVIMESSIPRPASVAKAKNTKPPSSSRKFSTSNEPSGPSVVPSVVPKTSRSSVDRIRSFGQGSTLRPFSPGIISNRTPDLPSSRVVSLPKPTPKTPLGFGQSPIARPPASNIGRTAAQIDPGSRELQRPRTPSSKLWMVQNASSPASSGGKKQETSKKAEKQKQPVGKSFARATAASTSKASAIPKVGKSPKVAPTVTTSAIPRAVSTPLKSVNQPSKTPKAIPVKSANRPSIPQKVKAVVQAKTPFSGSKQSTWSKLTSIKKPGESAAVINRLGVPTTLLMERAAIVRKQNGFGPVISSKQQTAEKSTTPSSSTKRIFSAPPTTSSSAPSISTRKSLKMSQFAKKLGMALGSDHHVPADQHQPSELQKQLAERDGRVKKAMALAVQQFHAKNPVSPSETELAINLISRIAKTVEYIHDPACKYTVKMSDDACSIAKAVFDYTLSETKHELCVALLAVADKEIRDQSLTESAKKNLAHSIKEMSDDLRKLRQAYHTAEEGFSGFVIREIGPLERNNTVEEASVAAQEYSRAKFAIEFMMRGVGLDHITIPFEILTSAVKTRFYGDPVFFAYEDGAVPKVAVGLASFRAISPLDVDSITAGIIQGWASGKLPRPVSTSAPATLKQPRPLPIPPIRPLNVKPPIGGNITQRLEAHRKKKHDARLDSLVADMPESVAAAMRPLFSDVSSPSQRREGVPSKSKLAKKYPQLFK